jgi:integration host factor subunit alpha
MAITKADIADDIFKNVKIPKKDAREVVELFFDVISEGLEQGENVCMSGFGNWDLNDKVERPGRNPKTKEPVAISARRVVTYKPSQKVKERIESIDSSKVEVSKRREQFTALEEEENFA